MPGREHTKDTYDAVLEVHHVPPRGGRRLRQCPDFQGCNLRTETGSSTEETGSSSLSCHPAWYNGVLNPGGFRAQRVPDFLQLAGPAWMYRLTNFSRSLSYLPNPRWYSCVRRACCLRQRENIPPHAAGCRCANARLLNFFFAAGAACLSRPACLGSCASEDGRVRFKAGRRSLQAADGAVVRADRLCTTAAGLHRPASPLGATQSCTAERAAQMTAHDCRRSMRH